MKAVILVGRVADGSSDYITIHAIADEFTMSENPEYLMEDQVRELMKAHGKDLITHGFVSLQIPDDVLKSVTNVTAKMGEVEAKKYA